MKSKFKLWGKSLFNGIKNLKNKGPILSIIVLFVTIIILIMVYNPGVVLPRQEEIEVTGKLIILILQFLGLLAIILFLITILRWMFRQRTGTRILVFDTPPNDNTFSSKSIVYALIAEHHRLLHIGEYEDEQEIGIGKYPGPVADTSGTRGPKQAPETIMAQKRSDFRKESDKDSLIPTQTIDPNLTNFTLTVGGTSFSIGQIINEIKRLWSESQPKFTITGSLQKQGEELKLIVRKEGEKIKVWEVIKKYSDKHCFSGLIKEMAFKIACDDQEIMETQQGFSLYVEANDHYRQYLLTNKMEELKNAWEKVYKAIEIDNGIKHPPKLLEKLFFSYYPNGDLNVALEICRQIINLEKNPHAPLIPDIFNTYGNCCESLGKYTEAAAAYNTAIKLNPGNINFYYNLTLLYTRYFDIEGLKTLINEDTILNIIDKAKKEKLVDLKEPPSNFLGDWYYDLNYFQLAAEAYLNAILLYPKNIHLRYSLGITYQNLNENINAIKSLEKALELTNINPDDTINISLIYNAFGYSYSKIDNGTTRAVEFYKRSILEDPTLANSYYNLGIIYENMGNFDDAIGLYSSAFQLDPASIEFAASIALLYNRFDQNKEAIDVLMLLFENNKDNSYFHSLLGWIYCDAGELEKSIEEYKLAIDKDLQNPDHYRNIGYTYVGRKLINKAIDAFQESLNLEENPSRYTYAAIAACYKRIGKPSKYKDGVKFALQLKPRQGEDEYEKASFEALCSRTDKALKLLKSALDNKQRTPAYASKDWDFDFIKDDPVFRKLTGTK